MRGSPLSLRSRRHRESLVNEEGQTLACVCFAIVGIGYLFPFSALTLPVDYWNLMFPSYNIDFQITSLFIYINLAMLAVIVCTNHHENTTLGGRIWFSDLNSKSNMFAQRILLGFFGQFAMLVFIPSSYFFGLDEKYNAVIVLGSTAFAAVATAFLDSSLIALASQYPVRIQEYFQLGVGLSSLIGALYRDFTKLALPQSKLVESSLLYFYAGAVTILICMIAFCTVLGLSISKRYLPPSRGSIQTAFSEEKEDLLKAAKEEIERKEEIESLVSVFEDKDLIAGEVIKSPAGVEKSTVLALIFKNGIIVSLVFTVSLSVFPPLITEIPVHQMMRYLPDGDTSWWPLALLTIFSIFDCAGRLSVPFRMGWNKNNIWIPAVLRIGLIPCIALCVQNVFFQNDWWPIAFVSVLGFTNGYLGTLSIVFVTEGLDSSYQATAGMMTSFFINFGLVMGASIGLLFEKWIVP